MTPKSDRRLNRSLLFLCLGVLVVAGTATRAFAFTNPTDYGAYPSDDPATVGVGSGRYFTGSPADGYSCEVCHTSPSSYSFPLAHKGLPLDGYVPGQAYKVELSWAEATAAYKTAQMQGLSPVSTLIAEFVAEDGGPAGSVSFPNEAERISAAGLANLYCETLAMASPMEDPGVHYGMNIYVQDTSSLPIELTVVPTSKTVESFGGKCTVERNKDDEGNEFERRCIVAMKPCGPQAVKFTWTAPEEWRGPIWFSAGFVTTYDRTTAPNDNDFVSTLSIPLNPGYEGGEHVTALESGCSVASGLRAGGSRGIAFGLLGIVSLLVARRRQRHKALATASVIGLALSCSACTDRGNGLVTNLSAPGGAYEATSRCTGKCDPPIECRESAWADAGTAEEAAEARKRKREGTAPPPGSAPPAAGGGAAGAGSPGVKSLGSITAQFTTTQPAGLVSDWVGKCPNMTPCQLHYMIAWIDQEDESGERKYVRTLRGSTGAYVPFSVVRYVRLGADCQDPTEIAPAPVDTTTTATIWNHQAHSVTWDGLFGSGGKAAPAGTYHLRIEAAIDETHHFDVADIPFTFGDPAPAMFTSEPQAAHTGVTISYTPNPP